MRILRSRDELHLLLRAPRRARFGVRIPELSDSENEALEERLRKLVTACGCGEATVGLMAGIAADIALWLTGTNFGLIPLLLLPPVLMIIGKVLGRWRARRQLMRLIDTV